MSEKLTDPSKAAHEIVEVLEDGDAVRNDGVRLTAANKNPWYVLATIHGEQEEGADSYDYNAELAAENRQAWNRWFCGWLSEEQRNDRAEASALAPREFTRISSSELTTLREKFRERLKDDAAELPNRTQDVDFSNTYFPRYFHLEQYMFENDAYFVSSTFNGDVNFSLSTFSGEAYFLSSTFCGDALFASSTFSGFAHFPSATFYGDAFFGLSTFRSFTFFESSMFSGSVDFRSAKFSAITKFNDAWFLSAVPEFHAAEIYDDTIFPTRAGDLRNWPPLSGKVVLEGRKDPVRVMDAVEQKRAYNWLRLFMNRSLQFDEEQFFHRQEMRCKREIETSFWMKFLYGSFDAISDYGNSIWKPMVCLVVLILCFAAMMLFHLEMGEPATGDKFWTSLGWSISNMLPFLGAGKLYYGAEFVACLPVGLKVLGGVPTLLGFILLFLVGLGLRNRFRLR